MLNLVDSREFVPVYLYCMRLRVSADKELLQSAEYRAGEERMAGLVQLLGLAAAPLAVSAHANIVWPYTWFDKGGNIGNNHNHSIHTVILIVRTLTLTMPFPFIL